MKNKLQNLTIIVSMIITVFSFSLNVFAQTQRNPVLEEVTGTWCQWCPCGHDIMAQIKSSIPNAILIGYHGPANTSSDPFSYFPGNTIISSFGFSAYPTAVIDRTSGIQSRGAWPSLMATRNTVPATVAIDVDRSFNELTREFSATIDFTALTNLNGQYKFNVILLEDGIVWSQTGNSSCPGNPNYVHKHLVRDMMNGALGEEIVNGAWNANDVITKTVSHTVPLPTTSVPDMVWDSCHVVVLAYKVGSPLSSAAEIQQAVEMTLKSPDYVATLGSTSPDIIGENNVPGQYTSVLENIGLLDDTYDITCTFDGPSGWTGGFTTINGSFAFGETNAVLVATGNSTNIDVTINPNGHSGSGVATLSFESMNNPGLTGSIEFRFVTTTGLEILVIDASDEGYGDIAASSVARVFSGSSGIVSSNALNPTAMLDNFQMIVWSAGVALPVFVQDEVDILQDYLDAGGNLFINGQDIGADIFGSGGQSQFAQGFYNNYMHASFVGNGTSFLINGIAGDPITNGIQFVLNDVYTRSPDNIAAFDGLASSIFIYLNGPNVAGIKAMASNYKVVYFGFGFEQITDTAIQDTLVSKIINYFGVSIVPVELTSFTAVSDNGDVQLNWQTATENNNHMFEIERRTKDNDFRTIGYVEGHGTTTEPTNYQYTDRTVERGIYTYRLKQIDYDGTYAYSDEIEVDATAPISFALNQNYPNPFNPSTTISYAIPSESQVKLVVYDVMGRQVADLVNEKQSAGEYNVDLDASSMASGTYFYKLTAGEYISVKKMVLLK